MAKFIQKIGTTAMKYQFDLKVFSVKIQVPESLKVIVVFKSGPRIGETKEKPIIQKDNPKVEFDEKISIIATIQKDKAKGNFLQKKAKIVVSLQKNENIKRVA